MTDPKQTIQVDEFHLFRARLAAGAVSPCACLGPQAGDPHCPCVMRQKGLKSNVPEPTAEERAKVEEALREVFSRYPGKN